MQDMFSWVPMAQEVKQVAHSSEGHGSIPSSSSPQAKVSLVKILSPKLPPVYHWCVNGRVC